MIESLLLEHASTSSANAAVTGLSSIKTTSSHIDHLDRLLVSSTRSNERLNSPSFILDLALPVRTSIRNLIDYAFLPSFARPTIAVLFAPDTTRTWTGFCGEVAVRFDGVDTMRNAIWWGPSDHV